MSASKDEVFDSFQKSLDAWLGALDNYSLDQLLQQPATDSWCLGQVYMHIISETNHFLTQAELCLGSDDHSSETVSEEGTAMFGNDGFPDLQIVGPPSNNDTLAPSTKEELRLGLQDIREKSQKLIRSAPEDWTGGKTRHPGLGYFHALEWLQFSAMHMRHHMRQRARIDAILAATT
jgi:hypothetical protein